MTRAKLGSVLLLDWHMSLCLGLLLLVCTETYAGVVVVVVVTSKAVERDVELLLFM